MYAIFVGKEKGQQKNDMAFLHQCISEIWSKPDYALLFLKRHALYLLTLKSIISKKVMRLDFQTLTTAAVLPAG